MLEVYGIFAFSVSFFFIFFFSFFSHLRKKLEGNDLPWVFFLNSKKKQTIPFHCLFFLSMSEHMQAEYSHIHTCAHACTHTYSTTYLYKWSFFCYIFLFSNIIVIWKSIRKYFNLNRHSHCDKEPNEVENALVWCIMGPHCVTTKFPQRQRGSGSRRCCVQICETSHQMFNLVSCAHNDQ